MKLIHLNESEDQTLSQFFKTLSEQSDFLKYFENKKMYHGAKTSEMFFKRSFKFRKAPRDTSLVFHNTVNQLCEEKFNIPVRNLLFCAKDNAYIRSNYGRSGNSVYRVIPMSNTRMFTSPMIEDLTNDMDVMSLDLASKFLLRFVNKLKKVDSSLSDEINSNLSDISDYVSSSFSLDTHLLSDDLNQSLYKDITEFADGLPNDHEMQTDKIRQIITECVGEIYQNFAVKYVSSIEEISSLEQFDNIPNTHEIMVYSDELAFIKEGTAYS